jgi:hypothetical protein
LFLAGWEYQPRAAAKLSTAIQASPSNIPTEIANTEIIIRAVVYPYHVNDRGKLKIEAFEPPFETDKVSVMRGDYLSASRCKQIAKERVQDLTKQPPKVYAGLATIQATSIRHAGAGIDYTPEEFDGHADIRIGFTRKRGEPLDPEPNRIYKERLKALLKAALYFSDPAPQAADWTGGELKVL